MGAGTWVGSAGFAVSDGCGALDGGVAGACPQAVKPAASATTKANKNRRLFISSLL
jgi:hypothetical protein